MKTRIAWLLLAVVLTLGLFAIPTAAASAVPTVYDPANLLYAYEEQTLTATARDARERTGCAFYVATYRVPEGGDSYFYRYVGEDFLEDFNLSEQSDIVVVVLTLDDGVWYYDYYTYGRADRVISQKEVDYMLDHDSVYDVIKGGDPATGLDALLSLSADAYAGRVGASYVTIAIVAFVLAAIVAVIACVGVYASYKAKKRAVDYPLDRFAKLELTAQNDVFKGSFVTRRVIQSNSGGGGGSSHGGGGGHRGGR